MTISMWLSDIEPRTFYKSSVIHELQQFGIETVLVTATKPMHRNKIMLSFNGKTADIHVNTWDDDFDAMKLRGLPFFLVDHDYVGEPENHKGYTRVPYDEETMRTIHNLGLGFIADSAEARETLTVSGSSIYRAVAKVTSGVTPGDEYHGHGSAARANLEAVRNWESDQAA